MATLTFCKVSSIYVYHLLRPLYMFPMHVNQKHNHLAHNLFIHVPVQPQHKRSTGYVADREVTSGQATLRPSPRTYPKQTVE